MNDAPRPPRITFDDICNVVPMDYVQVAILTGLVGGALYAFIERLVSLGLDRNQLGQMLSDFAAENHFDLSECDPRFWESWVDGLLQIKEFGYPQLVEILALDRPTKVPTRISRYKYLESTLPPYREGRDRKVMFENDGTIVYAKEEGDWEPPRDITGYERDANDPWVFRPLWPECLRQHGIAVRKPACGCINVIIRCNNRESPHFREVLKPTDCDACAHRQEPKKGETE